MSIDGHVNTARKRIKAAIDGLDEAAYHIGLVPREDAGLLVQELELEQADLRAILAKLDPKEP